MKRELPLAVALTLLASSVAQALGLGPLERRSALNEPFEARIPITGATAEDLDTLRVGLAGTDAFRRAGIERGLLATRLRFELVQPPSGSDFIRVTTRDPVGEPFVSFLIELNWAAGRLFREYTALLDPPNYQRAKLQVTTPAPASARPVAPPARPVVAAQTPSPVAVTPAPSGGAPAVEPFSGEVRVESGDTLWGLADPVARRAGVKTPQAIVALWRANPDAFVAGNMNALRAGAILRLPDSSAIGGISNAEALALMAQQNELWQQYRSGRATSAPSAPAAVAAPSAPPPPPASPPEATAEAPPSTADDPQLKLLAPAPEDASQAGDAGLRKELELSREEIESRQAENNDLRTRLDDAERLIAQLERALEVRNDELAKLQGRLGDAPSGERAEATPLAVEPPAADQVDPDSEAANRVDSEALGVSEPDEADTDTDPLDILERDLDASADGVDSLDEQPDTAEVQEEDAMPPAEAPSDTAASPASDEVDATDAATLSDGQAVGGAPEESADATVTAPAAAPTPAPESAPSPQAPADALTQWAESVVPPDLSRAVPGGALAVLGAAGAALLALLGLFGARLGGRRRQPPQARAEASSARAGAPVQDAAGSQPGVPVATAVAAAAAESTDVAELTDVPLEERTLEATARELAGQAPVANEVDDLLTEMNVYLAYEQFDQAESLVRRAIDEDPGDPRRHQYLLDIFYAKGDVTGFEKAAATLRDLTGASGPAWDDVLTRWQELARGRELFASAGDEPFEVTSQRTFVDLTADDLKPEVLVTDVARAVDASAGEDPYSATATQASGELPVAPAPVGAVASAPSTVLDFGLAGASTDSLAVASAHAVPSALPAAASVPADAEAFFDPGGTDAGLDFADEAPTPSHPAAEDASFFDPTAGEELALIDVTGGEEVMDADAADLIDITSAGLSDADGIAGEVFDLTGGDENAGDVSGTGRPEQGPDLEGKLPDDLTRSLTEGHQLLDITASGATSVRDLQDMLDVSLDGGGLGDLLDVSGPTPEGAGVLDAAPAPESLQASGGALDVPLEFDVTGLAAPAADLSRGESATTTPTSDLPPIDVFSELDLSLDGEQGLGDTFDRPHGITVLADDDTQSLDELAQALEETASRMSSAASPVPDLGDFPATRTGSMPGPEIGAGSVDGAPAAVQADFGDIDFDLLSGDSAAPAPTSVPSDDGSLSLAELEAALSGDSSAVSDHAGEDLESHDLGDLSSADSWLNLAHAYIEIGDPASAREELERVLAEGNPEQQAQARQLLEQIRD